jgi:CHASE3 domain sensor protein
MEVISALSRAITGRLFTDEQIKSITSGAMGKYFADFFPTPKDVLAAEHKVETAHKHIAAASAIILEMQENLESQNQSLEHLLKEIEEKKSLADRYQTLAQTNEAEFKAFREQMEESLRKELTEQAAKGRRLRQAASLLLWIITLVVGAALGAYFKEIVSWANTILVPK